MTRNSFCHITTQLRIVFLYLENDWWRCYLYHGGRRRVRESGRQHIRCVGNAGKGSCEINEQSVSKSAYYYYYYYYCCNY